MVTAYPPSVAIAMDGRILRSIAFLGVGDLQRAAAQAREIVRIAERIRPDGWIGSKKPARMAAEPARRAGCREDRPWHPHPKRSCPRTSARR